MASPPFSHTWEPSRPRYCFSPIQHWPPIFLQRRCLCSSSQTSEMHGTLRLSWPVAGAAPNDLHCAAILYVTQRHMRRGGADPGFLLCKIASDTTMAAKWEGVHALEKEVKERTVGNAEPAPTPRRYGRRRPAPSRPS